MATLKSKKGTFLLTKAIFNFRIRTRNCIYLENQLDKRPEECEREMLNIKEQMPSMRILTALM